MISRRAFLRDTGLTLAALGVAPSARSSTSVPPVPTHLVVVFQRGAADGLSMVVPYTDPLYYRRRPTIAVAPPGSRGGAIDLDGRFAFHPRLAPLVPLYRAGQLAVVRAGRPAVATQSHLEAQDAVDGLLGRVRRAAAAAGSEVTIVDSGHWDDHVDQGGVDGRFASRLETLATTLSGIVAESGGRWRDTVVVTMTEFGRALTENARGGTDHGSGSVMLIMGGAVDGGRIYGNRTTSLVDVLSEYTPWPC
jgi:uncharacterized protein (DUF1501 family)